jgi:arsenical pump membrane protein
MAIVDLALLAAGVAGALVRPFRLPGWLIAVLAVALGLVIGSLGLDQAGRELRPLVGALAFVLAAVPLSVLLDRLGFFEQAARLLARGRRTAAGLWVLAAFVTAVLNLDASVVLLTPLYVRMARQSGMAERSLAFQPVLLACLASSFLPVSNLTNLIAAGHTGATPVQFLVHLGPPSLAATVVGYVCYRKLRPPGVPASVPPAVASARPLVVGGGVVAVVLAGFVAGPSLGIEPWQVALAADAVLIALTRYVPLRQVPWGTALVAAALAVLAGAAIAHADVAAVVGGHSLSSTARTVAVSAVGASLVNNLPATLVGLHAIGPQPGNALWALLLGVNVGPLFVVTGSLAGLLWMDALDRLRVRCGPLEFSRVGLAVGVPALIVATGVLVGLQPLLGRV